jgi:transcriptional regulator with XRE-family HTH domain
VNPDVSGKAARALLEWSQAVLAHRSGVSLPTIKRLEPGNGVLSANYNTVLALERALETAGVEFSNSDQPGVRLRAESPSTEPHRPAKKKKKNQ